MPIPVGGEVVTPTRGAAHTDVGGGPVSADVRAARADAFAHYADGQVKREEEKITADRAAARKELEGKFNVVKDDYSGERKPNTVTESEYEKLVHRYSDIRLGRTDIKLATDGMKPLEEKKFREGTMNPVQDPGAAAAALRAPGRGRRPVQGRAHLREPLPRRARPARRREGQRPQRHRNARAAVVPRLTRG